MTQLETNKKMVVEFYEKAINEKDFDAASQYSITVYATQPRWSRWSRRP
jgi:predicted SnoaL-like aldol condensation-catalyzing enzyme